MSIITENQKSDSKIDLKFEIFRYLRYWYWFFLSSILFLTCAYFYLRYTPNVYGTSAKIKILDNSSNTFKMPSMGGVSLFARPRINLENEVEILKSYRLNEQVAINLGLQTQFTHIGYISEIQLWNDQPFNLVWLMENDSLANKSVNFEIELEKEGFRIVDDVNSKNFKKIIPYNQRTVVSGVPFKIYPKAINFSGASFKYRVNLKTLENATRSMISSISISNVGKESEILSLSMNGQNLNRNESVMNELINVFDKDGVQDRQKVSERTIKFVNERFVSLTRELDSIERNKAGYKSQNSISFIEADAGTASLRKEAAFNDLMKTELQVELSKMLNKLLEFDGHQLLPGDIGLTNTGINDLINEYNKIVLEKERVTISTGIAHPKVILIIKSLDELKRNLKASIVNYQDQLNISKNQLQQLNIETIGLYSMIPEKEKMVRSIERQQQIKESLYMILLQKREEAAINLAITEPSIKVVDYAITNKAPLSPKRGVIWLGSLIIGLFLPFALLYLYFISDTKLHTKSDLSDVNPQIPVVAEIPHMDNQEMVMEANDRSVLGEAFRILRTNISYLLPPTTSTDAKVIFVTSTIKGEGKTFTSTNTGIAFTALKKKVLLIGADVRNPQLHKLLKVDKNVKGLTNYLYDTNVDWRENRVLGALNNPYLDVIYSGPIPPNPAEMLSNGRLELLLEEAKKEYDFIIVDTAPTILVTDTLLISQLADLTLYMTRANYTEKKLLEFSGELNEQKKLINMAYVINDIGAGKAYGYGYGYGYGYKYNYAYNYGYGYGYEEDTETPKKLEPFWKKMFKG